MSATSQIPLVSNEPLHTRVACRLKDIVLSMFRQKQERTRVMPMLDSGHKYWSLSVPSATQPSAEEKQVFDHVMTGD